MIKNKTAVLFAAACSASTILAGANPAVADHFYQYGLHLGYAFQLIDDVLDYQGDPQKMGKNVGDDLSEGKPTLPLIYVMNQGTEGQATQVAKALREKDSSAIQDIINIVSSSGALEYTQRKATDHGEKAKAALQPLPDSDYKSTLLRLIDLAITRTS